MRAVVSLGLFAICVSIPGSAWGPMSSMGFECFPAAYVTAGSTAEPRTARTGSCFVSHWSPGPGLDWQNQLLLIENDDVDPTSLALFIRRGTRRATLTQAGYGELTGDQMRLEVKSELSPRRVTQTGLNGSGIDSDGDGIFDRISGRYEVKSCLWNNPTDCANPDNYLVTAQGEWTAVRVPLELCLA